MKNFEEQKINIYQELEISEQQIIEGKVCDADEAVEFLRKKYEVEL